MNTRRFGEFILVLPLTIYAGTTASATLLEEINLHTMLESTTSVLTTLGDYTVLNPHGTTNGTSNIGGSGLTWAGSYGSSGWNYQGSGIFGGLPLAMNYSGTLSGDDGSDITVAFSGSGKLGSQPLLMNGTTKWSYDVATDDYLTMVFAQETKIGENSFWGWVVGAEFLIGAGAGVITGLVAGGAITLGTAGTGAPAGVVAGIKTGATVGGAATIGAATVSAAVKTTLAEDPQPAPAKPATPNTTSSILDPKHQGTVVTDGGGLYADDMFNRHRSVGRYAGGTYSGLTFFVSEPATIFMVGIALLGLLRAGKSRRVYGLVSTRGGDYRSTGRQRAGIAHH